MFSRQIVGVSLVLASLFLVACGDDTQSPVVAEHNGYYQRSVTRLDDGAQNACVIDGDPSVTTSVAILLPDGPEGGSARQTIASGRFDDGVRTWSMTCEWSDDGSMGDCLFVIVADSCVGQYRYEYRRISGL